MDPVSKHPGYVYLMTCQELNAIKIGWAHNPHKRLKDLRTGNPALKLLMYFCASRKVETKMHHLFKEWRISREWFNATCPQPILEIFISYLLWSIIENAYNEPAYVDHKFKESFEWWDEYAKWIREQGIRDTAFDDKDFRS